VTRASEPSVTFPVFGTTGTLAVTAAADLQPARSLVDAQLAQIDLACSRFRDDSELSRVNAAGGAPIGVSELFAEALGVALRAARLTDGDVDPTCGRALIDLGYDRDFGEISPASIRMPAPAPVPGWRRISFDPARRVVQLPPGILLDFGATAKAWASDLCATQVARGFGCGVLVSLGGDVAVAGPAPDGGWRIRVTDDHAAPADLPGETVAIAAGGLATSSVTVRTWSVDGRPVHHIVDPATGAPASSCWRTVSVAAATCVDANIASTAAIIRGEAAPGWLESLGLPARLVHTGGAITRVAGWPAAQDPALSQRQA
jgi:FAD:protein FMN transferase